jgi:hypothetical protein
MLALADPNPVDQLSCGEMVVILDWIGIFHDHGATRDEAVASDVPVDAHAT